MPSRMFASDLESSQGDQYENEAQPKGKKSGQSGQAPFILPQDEVDQDKLNDVTVDDGHLVINSVRVVNYRSKVSTEYSKTEVPINEYQKPTEEIGKKHQDSRYTRIRTLRNHAGFSWKSLGRRALIGLSALVLVGVVLFSFVATWILRLWSNVPELVAQPFESSVVYARDGETVLFEYYKEERREVVDLCSDESEQNLEASENCIPRSMQLAMIALEDEKFYFNEDGIPWSNIVGAGLKCLSSAGDECRGGSGLSQQLVKNVTKEDDATVERKITELLTAIKLNQEITKQDILYLYLNQVSFGRNAYGVQEAVQSYFGKDIKEVTVPEACYIASLVQKPTVFNASIGQEGDPDWIEFNGRKNTCLSKMHELNLQGDGFGPYIATEEELIAYQQTEVVFQPNQNDFPFPHFRDYVTAELRKFRLSEQALSTQGYKIVTTLDPDIQRKTEQAIKDLEQTAVINNGANNVAGVVLDGPSGQVLAMVGSRDYNDTSIDGQVNVVTSPQQPGSSIKPYVYAAAMNQGFNPGTILLDVPTTFDGGFRPKNYSGRFNGPLTIRTSLQNSYNIPAVKAAYLAAGEGDRPDGIKGINKVFDFSEAMGVRFPCIDGAFNNNPLFIDNVEVCTPNGSITSQTVANAYRDRCYVSAAIGGCEVTMISHATGMNTFAQDGNLRTATPFISIINTQTGEDIYQTTQNGENPVYPVRDGAIDPLIARQMNNVLSDYAERYREFGNSARNLELDGWTGANAVAAKTGTTDQVRDTWTVGYSPYYTVAVWVGNTDNSPMIDSASSSSAPAPIWKSIMTFLHEGKEKRGFSREGLVPVRLDPRSGYLLEEGGKEELLTPDQIRILKEAAERVSKPEYDPKAHGIFDNRSAIIRRILEVNQADGLLAVEGKTLTDNVNKVACTAILSEFPLDPGWFAPAENLAEEGGGCPNKQSEMDQVTEQQFKPTVVTNISGNGFGSFIDISATPTGNPNKGIRIIRISIDGQVVFSVENTGIAGYQLPSTYNGSTHDVKIEVWDTWFIKTEINYNGVTLGSPPLVQADLQSLTITCQNGTVASTTTCTFQLPVNKSLPGNFQIGIGNGIPAGSCAAASNSRTVICTAVPTGSQVGNRLIYVSLGEGAAVNTQNTVLIT